MFAKYPYECMYSQSHIRGQKNRVCLYSTQIFKMHVCQLHFLLYPFILWHESSKRWTKHWIAMHTDNPPRDRPYAIYFHSIVAWGAFVNPEFTHTNTHMSMCAECITRRCAIVSVDVLAYTHNISFFICAWYRMWSITANIHTYSSNIWMWFTKEGARATTVMIIACLRFVYNEWSSLSIVYGVSKWMSDGDDYDVHVVCECVCVYVCVRMCESQMGAFCA